MVEGKTREETVRFTAEALGISLAEAGFIVAQELGEIEGDVITVDDDGNPGAPASPSLRNAQSSGQNNLPSHTAPIREQLAIPRQGTPAPR
jgi:hypothetical protein